jgi:hypothetical protein
VLRLGTGVRGDFAHAVEISASMPRAQNRVGGHGVRRDFRARFCTPYDPRMSPQDQKQRIPAPIPEAVMSAMPVGTAVFCTE